MMMCHSNIARWLLSKVIILKLSPSILTEPKLFCQEKREKPLKGTPSLWDHQEEVLEAAIPRTLAFNKYYVRSQSFQAFNFIYKTTKRYLILINTKC